MKMDDRCRWCGKLPAALAHLPNRNHRDLVQLCGLWCFLFHTLAHRNFWAFWQRFSWRCGLWWCFFPSGFSCTRHLTRAYRSWKGKTGRLFWFLLAASPGITWNNLMGHLSSSPVANIFGLTSHGLTFKPPCLVFVRPSANMRNSFPSSSRSSKKSSTFIWWCSWHPRRPKCCVISPHIVLIRERGLLPPSWPFSQRISSSSFVRLLDRFGRFPFPCSLSFRPFLLGLFLNSWILYLVEWILGTTSTLDISQVPLASLSVIPARSHLHFLSQPGIKLQ